MSKITAYTPLATTQPDDVLPIVDIHDTTMASSGTTKKVSVSALVNIDTNAADIQPTALAVTAGATGKTADAGHTHLSGSLSIFNVWGTGADGAVTLDGAATFPNFSTLASNVYTLLGDIHATTLVINNGITLKTNGWRILATVSVTNNGTISNNGGNASGTNGGTSGASSLTSTNAPTVGNSGGAGATGVGNGGSSTGMRISVGGSGSGGSGTSGAGGGGSAPRLSGVNQNALRIYAQLVLPMVCVMTFGNSTQALSGGAGGAGGAGDGTNLGGAGGGAGGCIIIMSPSVTNGSTGSIQAIGGNGGTPTTTTGGCGGGGAGAGGLILIYTASAWTNSGSTNVSNGSPGTGVGTGTSGTTGAPSSGSVINTVLS